MTALQAHLHDDNCMQNATLHRSTIVRFSTYEKTQHDRYTVGFRSWCFYQKTLATGKEPGPHQTNLGTSLASDVAEQVKKLCIRLAHVDLLKRCTLYKTQNANDNLHSVVRNKCPNTTFVGPERTVDIDPHIIGITE